MVFSRNARPESSVNVRIGLDARFLTHPQPGGFKTYTVNLVRALGELATDIEYVVWIDRIPRDVELPQSDSLTYRVVRGTFPLVGTAWREQVGLRHQIARDRVDLVHFLCNTSTVGLGHPPFVVTLHDTIQVSERTHLSSMMAPGELKRRAIDEYSRQSIIRSIRRAARVITVSEFEKNLVTERLALPREQVVVIHEAPDPVFVKASEADRAAWRAELRAKHGIQGPFIMGLGFERRKKVALLIDAFARLSGALPNAQLVVIAAEENRRERLQQWAVERGVGDRSLFLGRQSRAALARLFNLTEAFVFPSERESFGLPVLEAMACGAPVIAMRSSSIPEVAGDGALLIDGTDPDAWTTAIRRVLCESEFAEGLRARGRRRATSMTWKRCAEATVQVYRDVMPQPSRDGETERPPSLVAPAMGRQTGVVGVRNQR